MNFRTLVMAAAALPLCLSVAVADTVSRLRPGTYAVRTKNGIEYAQPANSADQKQEQTKSRAMDAYLPKKLKRPVPAVVLVPGDRSEGGSEELNERAAWLASHGYAVFLLGYRLEKSRRAAVSDVQAAVRHVRGHFDEFGTDPNRIGVWGCADGAKLAVVCGLVDDPPLKKSEEAPAKAAESAAGKTSKPGVSARIQAIIVTSKRNPLNRRLLKEASFDDPAMLLLLGSGKKNPGRLDTPEPLEQTGIEYAAYRVPGKRPCRALTSEMKLDGEETPVAGLLLDFVDEHLKQRPLNLAVEMERVIVRRLRAQDKVLGSQSIIDLRAVLQRAAQRLGREPTPQEMKVARDHAKELADEIARVAAPGGPPPRVSRVVVAKAIARLSPQWPFTKVKRGATVPPVTRGNPSGNNSAE
jgi:hypothetical protein